MAVGLGALGWSPGEFWAATINEFNAAARGLAMANGAEQGDVMTVSDVIELERRVCGPEKNNEAGRRR